MAEQFVLVAIVLAAMSGVVGLPLNRNSTTGQWISVLLALAGNSLGIAGVTLFWATGDSQPIKLPWQLPGAEIQRGHRRTVGRLSAADLLDLAVGRTSTASDIGSRRSIHRTARKLRLFYGLLTAGMATAGDRSQCNPVPVRLGNHGPVGLLPGHDRGRQAGGSRGGLDLPGGDPHGDVVPVCRVCSVPRSQRLVRAGPIADNAHQSGDGNDHLLLGLIGFGFKAGVMPLHIWLPSAHTVAPSHVSAIMSGVIIKMGIYGLFRVTSLLPTPPLHGAPSSGAGAVSGILGVAFAIGQHDLKRLLAYHSIENIGIILLGLGLALIGRSLDREDLIVLGMSGGLLHVWNHAVFKALLFLSAGSVIHAAHTREIDQLGGLAKTMPWTALGFLVGAVAICGLPPLNGFVSEFLIYLGLFASFSQDGQASFAGAAFAAPALALIGTLALACFVKVYGITFLGLARSHHARHVHESPWTMIGPWACLGACCFAIGLAPGLIAPVLEQAIAAWSPSLKGRGPDLHAGATAMGYRDGPVA